MNWYKEKLKEYRNRNYGEYGKPNWNRFGNDVVKLGALIFLSYGSNLLGEYGWEIDNKWVAYIGESASWTFGFLAVYRAIKNITSSFKGEYLDKSS